MDKDTRKLLKAAEAQGFTWTTTTDGHPMVWKDGVFVTQLASTGSDWRGRRNAIAKMRKHGLVWPPKR